MIVVFNLEREVRRKIYPRYRLEQICYKVLETRDGRGQKQYMDMENKWDLGVLLGINSW